MSRYLSDPDDEAAGLNNLIAGINQEEAQQYALAVVSYENALRGGSVAIPAKFIGARLAGIKHDHPEEFDSGMALFLAPPVPQPYYPGMNPAMMNLYQRRMTPGMPGYPGPQPSPAFQNPGPQPSPVLQIPGTRTAPAPSAGGAPVTK